MAEWVVSSVGQTIRKLLINEAKFLWGVEGKVKDLQMELRLIQCLLKDADARREHDQVVGGWVVQLRDIAYDAEDVIERYILRVAQKKGQNIIKAYARFVAKCTCVQACVVGTEIDGLKSSISNLRSSMQTSGIQMVHESEHEHTSVSRLKQTYAYFEEDFVGREDILKVLVKELKDEKEHRVVSIWGMGGVGKTALAKKVLVHDEVKKNFDRFAWVCVSQDYQVKDILMSILVKLVPDQRMRVMMMIDPAELFETLYKIQQEKRCIVVLDDIWTKSAWDSLRAAFPIENTKSKLLITTRNREVAEYINPQDIHELKCLSDQESWDLLKMRVFPKTKVITENMKMLGDQLLQKCEGLPLAIIVLGGLLSVNEWEVDYKNINLHFGHESNISKVLALSYEDLPCHLKPCFLYLGSFPEDAEIRATKVLHMWIAEGFVLLNPYDEEREIQVEDVAKQYLTELVNRGMVQVQFNSSGKIKTCHLNRLVRNFCVSKAQQESFLSTLNIPQDHKKEDSSSPMAIEVVSNCKIRRLSLNLHLSAERNMFLSLKPIVRTKLHLRTFMFFGSVEWKWKQFQPIFIHCKFLRILKLEDLSSMRGNLPESVGVLVQLRFLSVARSDFASLPQSMRNLVCMEFLDLRVDPYTVVTVPNVLWKMRRLRHLHLPYHFVVKKKFYGDRGKLRLDTLKNLRTLGIFGLNNCDVDNIGKLTNLRKLTISKQHGSDKLEIIPQIAKFNLKHLQTSSFRFSSLSFTEGELSKMSSYPHSCKLFIRGKIEKLPEHKNLPQQLRKLVLVYSYLKEDPMPILEKLHHLIVLLLGNWAFMGKEMVCSAGGFPQLEHLVLDGLPNLEEWRVAEEDIARLSRLRLGISSCRKLKTVPQGVSTYDSHGCMVNEYWKHSDRWIRTR